MAALEPSLIAGENKRMDWFVQKLYTPKGFFTPPYETAAGLQNRLAGMYQQTEVQTAEAMACFRCRKGEKR